MILAPVVADPPVKPKPKPITVPWEIRDSQVVYTDDGRRLFDAESITRAQHIVLIHNAFLTSP